MEKHQFPQDEPPAVRLSLAEEQRRAFEDDRRRTPQRQFVLRLSGLLFRN